MYSSGDFGAIEHRHTSYASSSADKLRTWPYACADGVRNFEAHDRTRASSNAWGPMTGNTTGEKLEVGRF